MNAFIGQYAIDGAARDRMADLLRRQRAGGLL